MTLVRSSGQTGSRLRLPTRPGAGGRRAGALALALDLALALALVLALVSALGACRPRAEESASGRWRSLARDAGIERPHVVLVTIDTLRADALGSYGNRRVETPNLDRLAREGVRFANAATTVPFTLPAHSSMMTGAYPPTHGVRENVGYVLDDRLPTLASILSEAGYATAGFVSAFVLDRRWGIARGFDTFVDEFELEPSGRANLGSVQRDGAETVERAAAWLDARPEGPFFLWVHLFDPHDPYEPPEPFASRYARNPYLGEVAYTDRLVGRLREELERRELLASSLVVVTSDHGEGLGSHREAFHGYFVYDSTVRVPLLVRPPFGPFAGRTVERPVSHVDLLPTVLEAVGLPAPAEAQGRSLLPDLFEMEAGERAVYTESLYPLLHYGWAPLRALRTSKYKLIEAPRWELYDLVADPEEQSNLADELPDVARRMRKELGELSSKLEAGAAAAPQPELDEETLRQLRALGYVAGRGEVAAAAESDRDRADPKEKIEIHQRIMRAQSLLGQGDVATAESVLQELLAADPQVVDAHQMLGSLLAERDEHELAVESYRRALALAPDHQASLFGLATAYKVLGRGDDALVGYRRLLELNPFDNRALLAVSELQVERGQPAEARTVLEGALATDRPGAGVLNRLGELYVAEGRREEAIELFRRAAAEQDRFAQPLFNLAVLSEEGGDPEAAIRLYREAIERAPRHFEAQFNLALLYGARGDVDGQQRLLEAAIESNPEFARGYYFLAKALMDRGADLARAEALVREGLKRDPENRSGPLGYYVLADILNRRGRPAEARAAAAEGRRLENRGGA